MRLGRYFVSDEPIGGGGMGTVYRARLSGPDGFERWYAAKRIASERADDPEFQQLFASEARLVARLSHANIVSVYDYGRGDDGASFLLMELVEGRDLAAIVREGTARNRPIPLPLALYVAGEALRGLHFAHEMRDSNGMRLGIVHRDVSPHNVLLSWAGEVKVTDFGIAKVRSLGNRSDEVLRGKIAYMSPEQASGEPVDPRSDLFSLGIVLWELICGRRLYRGATEKEMLAQAMRGATASLEENRPDVSPEIAEVVMALLAPRVRDRFRDAQAAYRAIAQLAAYPAAGQYALAEFLAELFPSEAPASLFATDGLKEGEESGSSPSHRALRANEKQPSASAASKHPSGSLSIPPPDWAKIAGLPAVSGELKSDTAFSGSAGTTATATRTDAPATESQRAHSTIRFPDPVIPSKTGAIVRQTPRRGAVWLYVTVGFALIAIALWLLWPRDSVLDGRDSPSANAAIGALAPRVDAGSTEQFADAAVEVHQADSRTMDAGVSPLQETRARNAASVETDLRVEIPRIDAGPSPTATGKGRIHISVSPWAELRIDGARVGMTPKTVTISAGRHVVELIGEARREVVTVNVREGVLTTIDREW